MTHRSKLGSMNGDNLAKLKEPLRSEFNQTVRGTNKATATLMNKRLELDFKERNINLEKLRRRQDAVYGTLLKVHKEKKLLQRAMYKKMQEESRSKVSKYNGSQDVEEVNVLKVEHDVVKKDNTSKIPENGEPTQSEPPAKLKVTKATSDQNEKSDKLSEVHAGEETTKSMANKKRTIQNRSKVLEVSKKTPLAPIVRERSDLDVTSVKKEDKENETAKDNITPRATQFTKIMPLPDINDKKENSPQENEPSNITTDSVTRSNTKHNEFKDEQSAISTAHSCRTTEVKEFQSKSLGPRKKTRTSPLLPTISEREPDRDIRTRHSDGSLHEKFRRTSQVNDLDKPIIREAFKENSQQVKNYSFIQTGSDLYSADPKTPVNQSLSDGANCKKNKSLVKQNRERARKRLIQRHNILDKESFTVYTKNEHGQFIPNQAPFKRMEFAAPSLREKHFQQKMLRAQIEARVDQRHKLENFFEKMAQEERERQRLRDAYDKAKKQEAEDARRREKEEEQQLGFSSSQLATLFSRGLLPDGVDPNSFEAIKYCKYIRTYSPGSVEQARHEIARNGKISSWSGIDGIQ